MKGEEDSSFRLPPSSFRLFPEQPGRTFAAPAQNEVPP